VDGTAASAGVVWWAVREARLRRASLQARRHPLWDK
jgi:hypothetical protein